MRPLVLPLLVLLCMSPALRAAEPQVVFEDKFDTKLGDGWAWLRENPKAWRIRDGGLEICVEPGLANNVKNALLRPAPDRSKANYAIEVTVTFTAPPTNQYEQAGITWYQKGNPVFKLVHEHIDGKDYVIPGKAPAPEKTVRLRLLVTKDKYTAQFQPDAKGEFKTVASGNLAPSDEEQVSIQCYNGPAGVEHWMRFDDLRITAAGKEWPQWCGSDCKNMASDEKGLADTFVPGKKDPQGKGLDLTTARNVKWAVRTGATTSLSTPAVAGGKVFLGANDHKQGVFKCLDAQTGRLLWKYTAPHREVPSKIDGDWPFNFGIFAPQLGICSSPAVDGNRVYFVNHRCEVVCLDIDAAPAAGVPPATEVPDAKVAWVFDMWETTGVRPSDACDGSPLIVGDLIYVCTSNGVDREASVPYADNRKTPAPNAPNLIVLEKKTGRLAATDDATHIGPNMLHGQWSSPSLGIVSGRQLIFFGGGDGVCYAFEALGQVPDKPVKLKTVWSFDCNPPEYKEFGGLDWATHYSLGDKRLKKSLNKKNEASFVGMSEIIGTPVFYKNRVYVAIGRDPEHGRGRGALWCIDAGKTGDITNTGCIWSYKGLDRTLSTVSIADGLLYIADVAGRIHCLDVDSGELYGVYETNETVWASTLLADGKIYLPTQKYLHVLQAGREIKPLAKITLGAPMWASAVAADGTLYVASTRYLWAVEKAK